MNSPDTVTRLTFCSLLLCLPVLACTGAGTTAGCAEATELASVRRCAEQGDAQAQFNLGLMYDMGDGVPQDDAEAVRWYRRAAEQDFANAQTLLGAKWYRLAAEQGDATAQSNLGLMYARGEGVPEDNVLAYMWLNLAAAQGGEGAKTAKDILVERMTREQITEAQRLSRAWLEAHPSGN